MTDFLRVLVKTSRRALQLAAYLLVVLPAALLRRFRPHGAFAPRLRESGWVQKPSADEAPPIVRWHHDGLARAYQALVSRSRRRGAATIIAVLLAPLQKTRSPVSPRVDPDIYAMH